MQAGVQGSIEESRIGTAIAAHCLWLHCIQSFEVGVFGFVVSAVAPYMVPQRNSHFMFLVYLFGVLMIVAFVAAITIGEDLQALLDRIFDLFHPTDRALRQAYQRSRQL